MTKQELEIFLQDLYLIDIDESADIEKVAEKLGIDYDEFYNLCDTYNNLAAREVDYYDYIRFRNLTSGHANFILKHSKNE